MGTQTLLLHIGVHKTGSSSLQAFFDGLKGEMLSHGLHRIGPEPTANDLYLALSENGLSEHVNQRRGIRTNESADRQGRTILTSWSESLSKWRDGGAPFGLISGEELSQLTPLGVSQLANLVVPFADRVRILCCLRKPVEYANSFAQELLKNGRVLEELSPQRVRARYRQRLEPWVQQFGIENFKALDYGSVSSQRDGLIRAVLEEAIIPWCGDWTSKVHRHNRSLSDIGAAVLSRVNEKRPVYGKNNDVIDVRGLKTAASLLSKLQGEPFRMPPSWMAEVEDMSREDELWVLSALGVDLTPSAKVGHGRSPAALSPGLIDDLAEIVLEASLKIEGFLMDALVTRLSHAEGSANERLAMELRRQIGSLSL